MQTLHYGRLNFFSITRHSGVQRGRCERWDGPGYSRQGGIQRV